VSARPDPRRRAIAVGLTVAVLGGTTGACAGRDGLRPAPATRSPAPITYSTIAAAGPPSTSATSRPAAASVPPARPVRLAIPAIGLLVGYRAGSRVGTVRSQHIGRTWTITPPEATWADLQSAYWWSEPRYSALPGDPSSGTTFVFMHACLHVVCAGNNLRRVRAGDVIRLTTAAGQLTYTVRRTVRLDKSVAGIGASKVVYSYGHPDQLRLVTCGYAPDGTSPFNWAVLATLSHQ
jgi:hypothetical protein